MPGKTSKITRLVFSGGGARGAVYPGAYAALVETGVFNDVKDIAGSSAGAFTAALLAVGISTKDFQRELIKINFADLLGNKENNAWFTKNGNPLYYLLHDMIKTVVLTFLKDQQLTPSHECWTLLQRLENPQYGPTFGDLETLINYWPTRFKRLTITAVKENGGDLKMFNTQETPNVEIALACRASGAIPVFLEPIKIDGENYIDGGVQENIPTESFDLNTTTNTYEKNKYPKQTLVFAFLDGDQHEKQTLFQQVIEFFLGRNSVFHALYGSRKNEHDNMELFEKWFALVEKELEKTMRSDSNDRIIKTLKEFNEIKLELNSMSIETLHQHIDNAVNAVSKNLAVQAASKNNPSPYWSWVLHVFTVISFVITAVWYYICSFFSNVSVDPSTKQSDDSTIYLNTIRDALKNAVVEMNKISIDMANDLKTISNSAQYHIGLQIHDLGPNKPPALFNRHPIEYHAYDLVPKLFTPFKSNYHPADKMEMSFQRIRVHYPLRTVALSVGDLSPIDFDQATKHARFMSTRGYLDTMNALLNLDLCPQHVDSNQFYNELVDFFTKIFNQILITANQHPTQNPFLTRLTSQSMSIQSRYYFIKEEAELDLTSEVAFALTLAVEYKRGEITRDKIVDEVEARCLAQDSIHVYGFFTRLFGQGQTTSEPQSRSFLGSTFV